MTLNTGRFPSIRKGPFAQEDRFVFSFLTNYTFTSGQGVKDKERITFNGYGNLGYNI